MKIYLVQHGEAASEAEDPERPLTSRGRDEVRLVAGISARMELRPARILHSGKRRAEETAEILAQALDAHHGVERKPGLGPKDDVRSWGAELGAAPRPLMVVGHLPFLSRLASLLLCGDPDRPVVRFRMGGIVCLQRDDGPGKGGEAPAWSLVWALTPEIASAATS